MGFGLCIICGRSISGVYHFRDENAVCLICCAPYGVTMKDCVDGLENEWKFKVPTVELVDLKLPVEIIDEDRARAFRCLLEGESIEKFIHK